MNDVLETVWHGSLWRQDRVFIPPPPVPEGPPKLERGGAYHVPIAQARILSVFHGEASLNIAQIQQKTNLAYGTVCSLMTRLCQRGQVRRVSRGGYVKA